MVVVEILIFLLASVVAKSFWENKKFYYLASKIPSSSFDFSLKGIKEALTADPKIIFKMLNNSFEKNTCCTKTWFGPYLFVGIVKPEDVKTVLNSKECLDKPKFIKFVDIFKGSLFGDLQYWHSHRKILNPYFGAQALRTVIPIFNEKSKILIKTMEKMEGKGEFNILYNMTALTLETIIKVMEYDVDIQNRKEEDRDVFIHSLEKFLKLVSIRSFKLHLHPEFIFKQTKHYKTQVEVFSKTAMVFAEKIKENGYKLSQTDFNELERSKTFIRALLNPKNNLTPVEIHDEILTVIFAAQDTSAIASSSTLLLLAMHKNVQQKVYDELLKVFGNTREAPYIDCKLLNQLEYLEMVINESMRLLPVVPYIFRLNSEDIEISEGYILPEKTFIVVPIFNIHRSKVIWGADAEEFKPERFSKENLQAFHPYSFIPFAKGPRMCVGWRYAMMLMKIQLANFLLRYEVDTKLKLEELEFQLNITMNICQGYNISVKAREL